MQETGSIHLLLLDNLAAFHSVDVAVKGGGCRALSLHGVHSAVAAQLKALAKQLKLAVVATRHAFRTEARPGRTMLSRRTAYFLRGEEVDLPLFQPRLSHR